MSKTIGFIGTGNMTYAFVNGLVNSYPEMNKDIFISNRTTSKAEKMSKEFGVCLAPNNIELVKNCDIIILSVKPNVYKRVLDEIKPYVTEKHILVSLAAGITIKYIESFFNFQPRVIRTMSNIAVSVGEGMTAVTANEKVTETEIEFVSDLFKCIGMVDLIDEGLMDVIPAISGGSSAYVYMLIEAMADGGVLQGMAREKAYRYAAQAVLGAAKMVLEKGKHPGELKDMVCSPGGTTIEAVYVLEKNNFRSSIIEAMNSSTSKAKQLAKQER